MSSVRAVEFELKPPSIASEAEITFAPTRTRIHCVSATLPATATTKAMEEFRHRVFWKPVGGPLRLVLRVVYEGEPPRVWNTVWGSGVEIVGTPTEKDWQVIYDTRRKAIDPEQRFMFDLDRRTNPNLIGLAPDIPECERKERLRLWGLLAPLLQMRLQLRKDDPAIPASIVVPSDQLRHFCDVFEVSTRARGVGDDWAAIGLTLERFAAGDLRTCVDVERAGKPLKIAIVEPDSYFVFYFAEFALACLDDQSCAKYHPMWTGLLPSFVKMQRYFLKRFPGPQCVTSYGEPDTKLTGADRALVDQEFRRAGVDRVAYEKMMSENLDIAGDCF